MVKMPLDVIPALPKGHDKFTLAHTVSRVWDTQKCHDSAIILVQWPLL